MRRRLCILVALAFAGCAAPPQAITGCEPQGHTRPICGFQNPEDLAPLPGGEALLVSEYGAMEGGAPGALALLVLETEARRVLFRGGDARGDATPGWGDAACPGPPPADFSPHGIDLARLANGTLALAVVQHGGRESIELFEVTGAGAAWSVAWRGCVVPPEGSWLNEVVLLSDGGLLTSHMMSRDLEVDAFAEGAPGHVLRWSAAAGFSKVAGSDVSVANGLEVSPDEGTLYLNSSMGDGLRRIDLATGEVTGSAALGALDNTTWAPDGQLLVAELLASTNEEFEVCTSLAEGACPIPYRIVAVDPATLETHVRFDGAGAPMGGGTVGLQVGSELFVGSFAGDRILRVDLSGSAASE